MVVIDGKNAVLGRLCAHSAKRLLKGEEIVIANAEKIILTGNPKQIVKKYIERRRRGSPQHGPFFPIQPDRIVRRTIRGMVPYKTNKGRAAMKRLRVFVSIPSDIKPTEQAALKTVKSNYITVGEIAKTLGWNSK